jgi:hypothetical protein
MGGSHRSAIQVGVSIIGSEPRTQDGDTRSKNIDRRSIVRKRRLVIIDIRCRDGDGKSSGAWGVVGGETTIITGCDDKGLSGNGNSVNPGIDSERVRPADRDRLYRFVEDALVVSIGVR